VLSEILRVLARRKWLIIAPMVLIFLAPSAAALAIGRTYVSEGTIEIEPNQVLTNLVYDVEKDKTLDDPIQEVVDLAAQLFLSRAFLELVAVRAGDGDLLAADPDGTVEEYRSNLEAFAGGPTLLVLRYRGRTPDQAHAAATAAIELLLAERRARIAANSSAAEEFFEAQSLEYRQNVRAAEYELRAFRNAHPEAELTKEHTQILNSLSLLRAQLSQVRLEIQRRGASQALRTREAALLDQIEALAIPIGATPNVELELLRLEALYDEARASLTAIAETLNDARLLGRVNEERVTRDRVLDPPNVPAAASRGKALTLAALALVVALAAAGSLVLLAEYLDGGVRREKDVVESAEIPVLAVVDRTALGSRP